VKLRYLFTLIVSSSLAIGYGVKAFSHEQTIARLEYESYMVRWKMEDANKELNRVRAEFYKFATPCNTLFTSYDRMRQDYNAKVKVLEKLAVEYNGKLAALKVLTRTVAKN
jgi:hypothetical protein